MIKKIKFIKPKIKITKIKLNLFSSYAKGLPSIDDLLVGDIYAQSGTTIWLPIVISDKRLKNHIKPIQSGIKSISQLKPMSFRWRNTGKNTIGLVAQDVKRVIPEAVVKKSGIYMIDYSSIISVLIQAVKDQQQEISSLKDILTQNSSKSS